MATHQSKTYCSVTIALIGLAVAPLNAQVDPAASSQYQGIPADWLNDFSDEIGAQVERFGVAYSLTPEAQSSLRQSLTAKLTEQWQFESKGFKSVQEQIEAAQAKGVNLEENSDESRRIMSEFLVLGDIGPLNDLVIAKELEATMDPVVAEQGRARLVDLIARRDQLIAARDDDFELQSGHNGSLADARIAADAPVTTASNPLPRGEKLAQVAPEAMGKVGGDAMPSKPVQPNAPAIPVPGNHAAVGETSNAIARSDAKPDIDEVKAAADALLADPTKPMSDVRGAAPTGRTAKALAAGKTEHVNRGALPKAAANATPVDAGRAADKGAGPSRPMPVVVEAVRLQAAPSLDDWDKYVDTTCKKFGFSDSQVIKAQSILKDLRNRAAAYRSSRNEDFAAAERLADAKAKADRKKELSAPIDAFFEELKQRLDNLATLEQRAKAAAPVPGKK